MDNQREMAQLIYKGAEVQDGVLLEQLSSALFELTYARATMWLRPRTTCRTSSILCLVELLEWFDSSPDGDAEQLDVRIARATVRWRSQAAWTLMARRDLLRGAGRQGKLSWESTRSVAGMRLATEIAVEDKPIPHIFAHQVCAEANGVALMLFASWTLKGIEAKSPLLLIFPGHCGSVLKKLGASPGRVEETEVILE